MTVALRPGATGFTLLEMLFVLFVVGLLAGLAVPRFAAGLEQRERLLEREFVEDQLRELPRRVRLSAHPVRWDTPAPEEPGVRAGAQLLDLPPGWTLQFQPPLEISQLGVCSGTQVRLVHATRSDLNSHYRIAAITCELSVAPA